MTCPACGGDNAAVARFCQHCGAALEPAAPEQRKVITVVFCDVTGSTTLGERLDPEVLRGIMGRFYDAARAVVLRHEGRVEKFIGDAVVAVFGVPVSREDDALRAVRAAAEIQDAVRELANDVRAQHGVELAVRTGVNTGEVVVGEARSGGSFATGDAVNTAARLEQAAGPGQTVLGASTYELVATAVEAEPLSPLALRGKGEAVGAYLLRVVGSAPERRSDTPFIGRERERNLLADALSRVIETQTSALVTVVGDAGLGKSRLVGDVLASVGDAAVVLRGRCLSYGEGITFWPIVEVLRTVAHLDGTESPAVVTDRLSTLVAGHPDVGAIATQLGPLLGAGGEPGRRDDVSWAVQTVVEHLAEQRPVVLDLDDVHWAEPALLDLLEDVQRACRDLPLLVVCQARPEFLTQRPGWGAGVPNVATVRLEPLSDLDATELITKISGLDGAAVEQVMAAAGGNPLYLEQLVAHMRDFPEATAVRGIPPTLAALLAARLDQLGEHERETVACAAIVGQVFHVREVAAVSNVIGEREIDAALISLSDRQIVRRSRADGRGAYRFRHVLVQEAAYDAQPKKQRAERHLRYADWLVTNPGEAAGELDAIRGWHLEQAHHLLVEVAPADAATHELAAVAAGCLATAGQARSAADTRSASGLFVRAAALTADPRLRAERLLHAAYLSSWDLEVQQVVLDDAPTGDETGPSIAALLQAARLNQQMFTSVDTEASALREVAATAIAATTEEGWAWGQALAYWFEAQAANLVGDWSRVMAATRRVVDAADAAGDIAMRDQAWLMLLASSRWGSTPVRESLAIGDAVLEGLKDAPVTRWRARCQLTALLAMDGSTSDFADFPDEPDHEDTMAVTFWSFAAATFLDVVGDAVRAAEVAAKAADLCAARGEIGHSSTLYGMAAAFLGDAGELGRARDLQLRARELTPKDDPVSQSMWRLAAAQLAAADGELESARGLLDQAVEWYDRTDQVNERGTVRHLGGRLMMRLGDVAAARRLLAEARELFDRKGNRVMTRRCDEELAALPAD